jgi:cell wall-associated NlpC family hydrolase
MIPANAKPGDFFLVSFDGKNPNITDPNKWLSHGGLIRLGQWANGDGFDQYEHAAIYLGNNQIVEASNSGTILTSYHYTRNDTMWSSGLISLSDPQRAAVVKAAHGYVGTPYSWPDYAALAAHTLHLLPATKALKDYVASTKHMICSQLVDQCFEDAGWHLFNDKRWPGYVTPGSLYHLLSSLKKG